jgi:ABC-2 type transport system permease protein
MTAAHIARGVYAIWLREVKRSLRDTGQLIGGVSRPLLWIVVLGAGLNPFFRGEIYGEVRYVVPFTYTQFIFPAVLVLNILYASVQSAVSLIWDREFGFLREVLVSPLPRSFALLGKVLGGATVALVHGLMVLAVAQFAGVPLTIASVLWAAGFCFLLAFGLTAFGIIVANHVRGFESFGVFSNAVVLPLYFTAGSVFPLDPALTRAQTVVTYPEWLVLVVEANPLTYCIDTLRSILIGFEHYLPQTGWWVALLLAIGFYLWAAWEFRRL